ncbi:hypothetical protein HIM_01545 [Hirsutella minnesotensis 3608]|nr:hypothetical protein HIM_01545 [Hirsutella minnesotensis 3608]
MLNITGSADYVPDRSEDAVKRLQEDFAGAIQAYLDRLTTNPPDIHHFRDIAEKTKMSQAEEHPRRNVELWEDVVVANFNLTEAEKGWRRVEEWTLTGPIAAMEQKT